MRRYIDIIEENVRLYKNYFKDRICIVNLFLYGGMVTTHCKSCEWNNYCLCGLHDKVR